MLQRVAAVHVLLLLLFASSVNALRFENKFKWRSLRGSQAPSAKEASASPDIDTILAELNANAQQSGALSNGMQSQLADDNAASSAASTNANNADLSGSAAPNTVIDTGRPVEVVTPPSQELSLPSGTQIPTIEASGPTLPAVPDFPAEPASASFPAPGDQLAGPPIVAKARVPAALISADDMSIEEEQEQTKLDEAIAAINEDLMHYIKQVQDETTWVVDVRKVIEAYDVKTKRVETNIEHLKQEISGLYKKKKQIENLKLQKQLQLKLKAATSDLSTLEQAMAHVRAKQDEFTKSKSEVLGTIGQLEGQLADLKGQKHPSVEKLKKESEAVEDQEQQAAEFAAEDASDD
jgi:predicted  nucleic acid-binding Zn-ribbon protein